MDERRLLRDGEDLRLRGKLFDTLRVLVENAGKLIRKDAFMEFVWPDSVVEENNLDYCISRVAIRMYADVSMANNRCAPVIVGVAQKKVSHPTYKG